MYMLCSSYSPNRSSKIQMQCSGILSLSLLLETLHCFLRCIYPVFRQPGTNQLGLYSTSCCECALRWRILVIQTEDRLSSRSNLVSQQLPSTYSLPSSSLHLQCPDRRECSVYHFWRETHESGSICMSGHTDLLKGLVSTVGQIVVWPSQFSAVVKLVPRSEVSGGQVICNQVVPRTLLDYIDVFFYWG